MPAPSIVFSTLSYSYLQRALCECGSCEAGELELRHFPDGERYLRILTECVDRDVVVLGGTVTDAVTGQPITGARVDDNYYGARPNRSAQQAWTDAQGHYVLRTWMEEHTLAASASGYQTKLATLVTSGAQQGTAQLDFQLQPAEAAESAASGPEAQALGETVRRGNPPWQWAPGQY